MALSEQTVFEMYGHLKFKFVSYYKFTFYFSAEGPEGEALVGIIGGETSDDIYKADITPELGWSRMWNITIKDKEGKELFSGDID